MRSNQSGNPRPWLDRALSHAKRAEILGYLRDGRRGASASELAAALDVEIALAEYHLKVLCDAGLVLCVDEGTERFFVAATSA